MQGKSGITNIDKWDTHGYSTQFAGEIKELDVSKYVNKKMARRLDDVIKYTIVAGKKVDLQLHMSKNSIKPAYEQHANSIFTAYKQHVCCHLHAGMRQDPLMLCHRKKAVLLSVMIQQCWCNSSC